MRRTIAGFALESPISRSRADGGQQAGRDISPSHPARIDLNLLGERLAGAGEVNCNDYLLRFRTGEFEMTIFQDARSIIRGTDDIATARSLYAKYVGN